MARLPSYVSRIDTARGVRYEARINTTLVSGKRLQQRKRFVTLDDAKTWHSTTTAKLATGTFTAPSDVTVKDAVEAWLAAKSARVKPTTADAYTAALQPVVDEFGDVPAQKITKHDVEALVTALRTGSGERGVWARTSINPMLARWRKVWADLHAQGVLARNVVSLVEPLRKPSGELPMKIDDSLTEVEVETLCGAHAEGAADVDRLARRREPFVHLALLGLRRGELAGLRWSALDLDAPEPSLEVRATRVSTNAGIVSQDDAKTVASRRTLPIPPHVLPILLRVRLEHRELVQQLGDKWEGPRGDGYLFIGELGKPLSPRTLDQWWTRSLDTAGLPHRRLHASRHTAASLLNLRGAPVPMIAAWLGHADGGVLAMKTYVHTPGAALTGTAALLSMKPSPTLDIPPPIHPRPRT